MYLTTRGLVLRETKYKEADKILTILTEDAGKLTVSARGALRKGSRIAAGCQLLTFSEFTLFENRGRWTVNEAQSAEQFLGLRRDISLLALGTYFAELLEAVSDEDSPDPEILRLGLNSLFALAGAYYAPEHIKAVFELRLMCLAGYYPQLETCPKCGEEPSEPVFSTRGGTVLCKNCAGFDWGEMIALTPGVLDALRYIESAANKKIFSFALAERDEAVLARVCESFVISQLERGFASLDYWRSVR